MDPGGGRGPRPRRARRDHRSIALDRHLQADHRRRQRRRLRRRARVGLLRRHPDRRRARQLRRHLPALERRPRRRRHPAPAADRRHGQGDGADHHRARDRRGRGRADRPRQRGHAERQCVERALELAAQIAELPQPAIRTDKEAAVRGYGRPLDEGLRIEAQCFNKLLETRRRWPRACAGSSSATTRTATRAAARSPRGWSARGRNEMVGPAQGGEEHPSALVRESQRLAEESTPDSSGRPPRSPTSTTSARWRPCSPRWDSTTR